MPPSLIPFTIAPTILGMFDIGNIIYKKYQLENNLDYIVDLYRVSKNIELQKYIN